MRDLVKEGYSDQQINQILKINDMGFDCSKFVKLDTDVTKLRELKQRLFKSNYSKAQRKVISKYYLSCNFDVTKYYDLGITYPTTVDLLYGLEKDGYDITPLLDKKLKIEQLRLMEEYLRTENVNIKPYLDKGYTDQEIKLCLSLEKYEIDYEKLKEKGYNVSQIALINNAFLSGYNILSYIDPTFTTRKIEIIKYAMSKKIDIKKITEKDYGPAIMRTIADALDAGYDITSYLDENSSKEYAEAILKALTNNLDPNCYNGIKNVKKYKLVSTLLIEGFDISKIDVNNYSDKKLEIITNAYKRSKHNKKIKVDKLLNENYSEYHMSMLIKMMINGKNISILENDKLEDVQIKAIYEASHDVDLTGLVDETTTPTVITSLANCILAGYNVTKKE